MTPTIATLVTTAAKTAQDHAEALAAHQAAHERYARERAAQPPAAAVYSLAHTRPIS